MFGWGDIPHPEVRGVNDRTRNNGVKLFVKHFNTSVAQHFYPIKITTTWNALPNEVVTSRTVNSFKKSLGNPPNVRVNWYQSSMPCTFQVCINYSRRTAFLLEMDPTVCLTTTTTTTTTIYYYYCTLLLLLLLSVPKKNVKDYVFLLLRKQVLLHQF